MNQKIKYRRFTEIINLDEVAIGKLIQVHTDDDERKINS